MRASQSRTSSWLAAAACALLLASPAAATAFAPRPRFARGLAKRASPTDLWVSVDGSGGVATVTPVATTVSGVPTVLSGAPNELTGTVFTITSGADVRTSTGTTPLATATAASGAGAFPRCFNKEGEFAPVCSPGRNASLFVGTQYYVTWDPDFFNQGNMTADLTDVKVAVFLLNGTTNAPLGERIDLSDPIRGSRGFYTWKVDNSMLAGQPALNVSLLLLYGATVGGGLVRNATGPTVLVQPVAPYRQPQTKLPVGPALYIGLPVILGVLLLVLFGTCLWNRRHRQIGLGNIMSRSRHGYGIGESRAQRLAKSVRRSVMRRGGKGQGIQLTARDVQPHEVYRDVPEQADRRAREGFVREDSFQNQAVGGGRNAFREEVSRQNRERF